jgi:glycosyltransferase involved in cell wall biosynthesis
MNPAQGGVVEAVNQAALSFNNTSHQMDVLCLDDPNAPWVLKNSSYTIHAIGKGKTAYGVNFSYFGWLCKNSREYNVVIIDGLWQFLVSGGYILKLLNVPYCVFTHGMLDPYFNENKLKYIKKLPFWFLVERNVITMANATIFTCQEESRLAKRSFPCYQSAAKVATLGVEGNLRSGKELSELFLAEHQSLKYKRFALFLSRINEKKGIDLLIDALAKIKGLPDDFLLAIAGPDSNGLKATLISQIERLGLSGRVVWLGMLSGDVKWGAYHAAEVFVLPSHQENFGIVVAEALSTATPVLITNKVNIWREIDKARAGIVENDDVEGVEKLLNKWLYLSDSEKRAMSAKAENCYLENFSIRSAADDLERVLMAVAN